jgi:hypothetical protein
LLETGSRDGEDLEISLSVEVDAYGASQHAAEAAAHVGQQASVVAGEVGSVAKIEEGDRERLAWSAARTGDGV